MSRKLLFEDGSTIEVVVTSQHGAKLAAAAYQRLIEFIDDELMDEFEISLQANGLEILENNLAEVDSDKVDFDEVELDEDEFDELDNELIDDDEEDDEDWELEDDEDSDDEDFTFR